jgi:ABC-type tungstate transport system permease subunit
MSCTWIGEGEGCSKEALPGRHYCEEHLFRVYQKGTANGKRKKDIKRANAIWDIENAMNEAVEELISEGFEI